MKRGIIAASVHGHTGKILIIFRKHNNSCLVLFAKIQNFSAYLMCIMLVQVFITHVIFFIWLIHVVFIRKNFGCFYFFQQCFAVITICISSVTVFHTDWSGPFIQHTAYRKTIRICKTHTTYSAAFFHPFFCSPGIRIFLLHRNMQHQPFSLVNQSR